MPAGTRYGEMTGTLAGCASAIPTKLPTAGQPHVELHVSSATDKAKRHEEQGAADTSESKALPDGLRLGPWESLPPAHPDVLICHPSTFQDDISSLVK